MNENVIKEIERLVAAALQSQHIDLGKTQQFALLPSGFDVHSLEDMQSRPNLHACTFETTMLPAFVEYCVQFASDDTVITISPESLCGNAIFDHGRPTSPGHGKHRASVAMKKLPAFATLGHCNQKSMSQHQFVDFILDTAEYLQFFVRDQPLDTKEAITRVRGMSVTSTKLHTTEIDDTGSARTAMESVSVDSRHQVIPDRMIFSGPAYEGIRDIEAVCRIITKQSESGDPLIMFRISQLGEMMYDIAQQVVEIVTDALGDTSASVFIGEIQR